MDQPRYENRYMPAEDLFLEYTLTLRPKWKPALSWAAAAMFAICLGIALAERRFSYVLLALIGLAACVMLLMMPRIRARLLLSDAKELGGGALHQTILTFEEEGFTLTEGASTTDLAYGQLVDVRESEHLFILLLGREDAVIVKKGAFTVGAEDTFVEYLHGRCVKALEDGKGE